MRKIGFKIWKIFTTLTVLVVLILALLLIGVRITGLQVYMVLSGSMEPIYPTGSVIYVKKTEVSSLKEGVAITFKMSGGTIATHRIVEIISDSDQSDGIRFRTKGDANDVVDGSLVRGEDIIGTPVFCIPYLGYLAAYIQKPPGLYLMAAVCVLLIFSMAVPDKFRDRKNVITGNNKKENAL